MEIDGLTIFIFMMASFTAGYLICLVAYVLFEDTSLTRPKPKPKHPAPINTQRPVIRPRPSNFN